LHPFWAQWESGTQTHFLVACPNCRHRFPFEDYPDSVHDNTHIGYEKAGPDYKAIRWSPSAKDAKGQWDEYKIRETSRYHCPSCDYPITEEERLLMLEDVERYDLNPSASRTHLSFRLPKFYTVSQTIGSIAWNRIKPGDLFGNIQHHQNSWLANPWQDIKTNVKLDDVRTLRDSSHYVRGTITRPPLGLYIGADVGDYKQHWVVGAIYENDEIDVIDYGTCLTIDDLLKLKSLRYQIATTGEWISPQAGLVDSKDRALDVFSMCRRSVGFWFPSRGSDAATGTWGVTTADYQRPDLYTFVTQTFKKALYIYHVKERQSPRFLIPRDAEEEFMHGLSGQQVVVINSREQFKRVPHDHFGDACIRLLLARFIMRAKRGETAPDIPAGTA